MQTYYLNKICTICTFILCGSIIYADDNLIKVKSNPNLRAKSYLLQDFNSKQILLAKNIHQRLPPASLTKLMTAYIIKDYIKKQKIKPQQLVKISRNAWKIKNSRMFARIGQLVSIQKLLEGIIVVSANEASIGMAEFLAGSEKKFAKLMNDYAKNLGLKNTNFTNSTGISSINHYSTAYDLAILSSRLIKDFLEDYKYYAQKKFTFNNIKQYNRNRLLWSKQLNVDGLKTGYTRKAGFCLISSATKNNMRLIAIVLNTKTKRQRAIESDKLLNFGFNNYQTYKIYSANSAIISSRIWYGKNKYLRLGLNQDLYITIPPQYYNKLTVEAATSVDSPLQAPIQKGVVVGKLNISIDNNQFIQRPLVSLQKVDKSNFIHYYKDHLFLYLSSGSSKNFKKELLMNK